MTLLPDRALFRDEDLRGDRQLESPSLTWKCPSFSVMRSCTGRGTLHRDDPCGRAAQKCFQRLAQVLHHESGKYGIDKPDLRFAWS